VSSVTAHVMNFHYAFVVSNTIVGPGEAPLLSMQGAVFKGWPTQQPFTVPLFRMTTPTGTDFVFMVGPDSQTPPVVSGFSTNAASIIAWVYDTPVCGSVPLMSAVQAAQTDHYYTIDPDEHAGLLANGWSDSGVVAFVLPLPTS